MTGHDRLGILLTVVLGFSFAHFVLFGGLGAGLAFFVGIFYICATLYLRARRPDGAEKPRHAPILFGVIILLTIANLMNSFQALTVLNTIALYLLIVLHLFYVYGKPSYPKYDFRMLLDVIQSTIAMPFRHFDAYFVGMFTGKKHKQSSLALRILLGLLIALPLAFFIIGILMAADDSFREMLHNVFELIATTFWQYLGHFLLGAVLIAPFIFSILYGCRHKTQIFGEAKPVGDGARIADRAVIYTILLVVLGVYLLFFCSQLGYFFPQLASPTPLQLSSYARRGFFELLFLAAFNLGLLGLFYAIIKRKDGRFTPVTKLLFTLFSLSSLLLMASACYKLYRYIEAYGLTRSRVYAAWFMAFLAIVFILVTIKVLVPKLRLFRSGFIAFIAMYLLINFAGVDYWVPAYNIHYFNGSYRVETPVNSLSSSSSAQGLDIDMFSELSDAMVPAVVKLLDSKDMETVQQVTIVLEDRYYEIVNNRKWETWNLSTHIAKKVLQERGIQAVEHNHLHPYEQYYDDPSYGTTSYDPEYDPNSYYDWGDGSQPDLSSYPIDPDDRMYNTSSDYHSAYN